MPTIEPVRQADGAITPPPDLNTGIARIQVIEARNLKVVKKVLRPVLKLYLMVKLF